MKISATIRLAAVVALGVACTDPMTPARSGAKVGRSIVSAEWKATPLRDLTAAERTAIRGPNLDDLFGEVASRSRFFAGMYLSPDGSGHVVINASDVTARASVLEAVRSVFRTLPELDREVEFRTVKYGYGELVAWRDAMVRTDAPRFARRFDIDEEHNHLYFAVDNASDEEALRSALKPLGLPSDALEVEIAPPPRPASATLDSLFRPLRAGTRMAGYLLSPGSAELRSICSLGQLASMNGVSYIITAAHCTNINQLNGNEGVKFFQPDVSGSTPDTNYIGQEASDPGFVSGLAGCPVNALCRYADAALIAVAPGVSAPVGNIARTASYSLSMGTNGSNTVTGILASKSELTDTTILKYRYIHKMGYRTGWTGGSGGAISGYTTTTCFSSRLAMNDPATGKYRYILCSYASNTYTGTGDSGGPVFAYWTDGIDPVNNVWAEYVGVTSQLLYWPGNPSGDPGYLVFSTLPSIRADLGSSLVVHQ